MMLNQSHYFFWSVGQLLYDTYKTDEKEDIIRSCGLSPMKSNMAYHIF
jgi:hypothetical protein